MESVNYVEQDKDLYVQVMPIVLKLKSALEGDVYMGFLKKELIEE
jgi:hypothetical protein